MVTATVLHISQQWLTYAGVFIPLLVGLVTKSTASSAVKAWVQAVLAAAAGALAVALTNSGGVTLLALVEAGVQTFVVSIAAYYGLWKPTTVAAKVAAVAPNVGIGA